MSAEVEVNKSSPEKVEDKTEDMGDAGDQGDTNKNDASLISTETNDKTEEDPLPSEDSKNEKSDHKDNTENGDVADTVDTKNSKESKDKSKSKKQSDGSCEESEQNSEEENEKDEEEEESDDEKQENASTNKAGGRERKQVQRYSEDLPETKEKMEGYGIALGNILHIDNNLGRAKPDDLKALHKLLFKNPGKSNMIRRNIRKFNGFDFDEDSEEYASKLEVINKMEIKQIKTFCDILDIEKKGTKEELATLICEFLMKPKNNNIIQGNTDDTPSGRPKRSAAIKASAKGFSDSEDSDEKSQRSARGKGQRSSLRDETSSESDYNPSGSEGSDAGPKRAAKGRGRGRPARTTTRKGKDYASDASEASEESEEIDSDAPPKKRGRAAKSNKTVAKKSPRSAAKKKAESEDSESEEEESANDSDEPKGKRGRPPSSGKKVSPASNRGRKAAALPAKSRGGSKRTTVNKKGQKDGSSEESEQDEDISESEDEPLSKKGKSQPPTDEELKGLVKEILDGANLEEITMKTVCKQVYAKYPQFDLAHKKEFIKTTVKSLIST